MPLLACDPIISKLKVPTRNPYNMASAWPVSVAAVYLICNKEKEPRRYERLIAHIQEVGLPAEKVRVVGPTWGSDLSPELCFAVYDPFLNRAGIPHFSFKSACLGRGEISLALNFYEAVRDATRNFGPGQQVIILESDSWLRRDFVQRLTQLLDSAPPAWDFISLGEGCNTRPNDADPSYYAPTKAYKPPHPWVFRCTDSMLFSIEFLKRLERTFLPFNDIIDWEMNFQMILHKGTPLWADPPIAEQGSWNSRLGSELI